MSTPTKEGPSYLERLVRALRTSAREVTPWFVKQMPESYFRDTDEETVVAHLAAVVAARISGASPRMLLRDEERETWTFIQERSYRGLLSGLLGQLPSGRPLASAKVHTAADNSLILDVFRFGRAPRFDAEDPMLASKLEQTLAYARGLSGLEGAAALSRYLERSSAEFVRAASPLRIHETWLLVQAVEGTDAVVSSVSLQREAGMTRISIAAGNADTQKLFERIVAHLGLRRGYDITRAFLDVFDEPGGWVSSLGFVVKDEDGRLLDAAGSEWRSLSSELERLPWLDDQVTDRLDRRPQEELLETETLVALTRLVHARLARVDPYAHTRDRLLGHLEQHPGLGHRVARLFLERFDPSERLSEAAFAERRASLASDIDRILEAEPGRQYFDVLLEAVARAQRTNVFVPGRAVFAIRIDPAFFDDEAAGERPYAVVFVHGRQLDGFHVRFANIARGGVRVVRPTSDEQYVVESERVYDEALGLARAQQLKNKDIPEGGAKAVVLVAPGGALERSVRAFVDALLDLTIDGGEAVIDRGGGPDAHLHLGPDENISPALIDWAVARAEARGHPMPGAFMSSKPEAGINHKDYGVTSEGVTVFLEEALRAIGIDPRKQTFTVKLTGGPDGDVAGNEIKILHREYGDRARVVGIADGSGAAWDPAGLAHRELLRLVEAGAGIAAFDPAALGPEGHVVSVQTPDGTATRNGLCFELEADAFIPAGGRPATLHAGNWRRFLKDGRPTSRVIVEGANLFLTPEARLALSEAGVMIVKDSSANKCGVICSSLEVAASMLLSREELISNKERLVEEVLERLRQLAREEARRLFADHARDPTVPLPEQSERLSRAILRTTNAVEVALGDLSAEARAPLDQLVREFLPNVVVELAQDRIEARLPPAYRDRVIATRVAARLVYREGASLLDQFSTPEALGRAALAYHRHEREVRTLAGRVRASGLDDAERVAELLEAGGARAALVENLSAPRP